MRNLLDKQIIDIKGNKMVRVNDVVIQEKEGFYIVGVDIGFLGILRWLKLEDFVYRLFNLFKLEITPQFLSMADVQPLELARGRVKLKKEEKRLEKLKPADLADYLERTNIISIKRILTLLDEKFAAEVIGNMNINYQALLFKQFDPEKSARVLSLVDSDEAVDILLTMNPKKRDEIITLIPEDKKIKILHLLSFSHSPIGEAIRADFLTVFPEDLVSEIIKKIQKETADYYYFNIIYVVNKENQLVGLFNLHEMLLQSPNSQAYEFMKQNIIVLHITTPKEIAIKKLLKYHLYSLPVINDNKHIIGIVTLDDLLDYKG
jgi:Mg/Co/Ni transporter MgtE